jgi:sugar-specific transcriptional regulator TrmB
MYKKELENIGFSEGEADVYLYLLKNGEKSAGEIIDGTKLKRGNTYNILESLVTKNLIIQTIKNKIACFYVENPRSLLQYIDQKKSELENKKNITETLMPSLISIYQLTTNKPVVSYYEGKDGFAHILNDTLTSKTEVLQYIDVEILETHFKKEGEEYLKKRAKLNIEKKLLVIDSPFARKLYENLDEKAVSYVRGIEKGEMPFNVTMYIYDNKVSYTTLTKEKIVAVIIEYKNIYNMHKHIFDVLYKKSSSIRE